MPISKTPRYEDRSILNWLKMADNGSIALPSFQRSYVWENQRIADYLMALFENRPTGIFLILETNNSGPQFVSRTLKGSAADTDPTKVQELVLDGQQRLTCLWNVLRGTAERKFYIEVEDLKKRNMEVKKITSYLDRSVLDGRSWLTTALSRRWALRRQNRVPIWIDGHIPSRVMGSS